MIAPLRFIFKNFEEVIAGTLLVLMALATLLNVVARYFFNSPVPWADEFSRYAFIWLVFVGAVVCTKQGRHISIDLVVTALPSRIRPFIQILADVATAALMLIIIYFGWILTSSATQPTSTLKVPQYVVYMVVPLSALLILLRTIKDIMRAVRASFAAGTKR
jgi:TRAP-type C4-dicarboxylate transport system permease small subunit